MYLFTRAFAYIRKQKAKTILLLILFIIIANIVLAGLSIQNATEAAKILTRQEIGADVIYTSNSAKINSDYKSGLLDATTDKFSLAGVPLYSNFTKLLGSEFIETTDVVTSYEVTSDVITPYVFAATTTTTTTTTGGGGGGSKIILGTYENSGDLSFRTFNTLTPSDFENELSTLLDGRFASQEEITSGAYVAIIETTLANLNGIKIGDKLSLTPTTDGYNTVAIEYEVIGIYQSNEIVDERSASMISSSLLAQNRIYTPFNTFTSMGYSQNELDSILLDKAVITLNDPANIEAYMASIDGKIDLVYGSISANDAVYQELAGPIDSLGNLSNILVLIVVIAGASILSLITALTINQRKNEIGILLAIGESKLNIVSQFIVEVVAIALIAFAISTFTGISVGKTISESTLASFASTAEATETVIVPGGGGSKTSTVTAEEIGPVELEVKFSALVLLEFFAAGILISIVSVAIPALYVTRFNPKQILTNNG
jgi:putative ABC transport system permease protein